MKKLNYHYLRNYDKMSKVSKTSKTSKVCIISITSIITKQRWFTYFTYYTNKLYNTIFNFLKILGGNKNESSNICKSKHK